MSRVAICQNHRRKQLGSVDGVAESVALTGKPLRDALKVIWPNINNADLESLIEYAESLVDTEPGDSQ